jgi:hypothetical protein
VCLGVKHSLTNGGQSRNGTMTPKCIPTLGVECLEPFERLTNMKFNLQYTIRKVLKLICLNCPGIVHLNLMCISYDQKKGQETNWELRVIFQ